jgi:hypothetical protein
MATVTSLNNYSFAFNGYVLGGASSPHQILDVQGLEGLPAIRNQDDNRGYFDGMFSGRDFLGGRIVTMTVLTLAGNGLSAAQNYNLLQTTILPQQTGTTPLQFQLSSAGGLQFINARVRANMTQVDPEYTYGFIKSALTFFCPDPRYYDNAVNTTSLVVQTPLGRGYNRTYNVTYGGGTQSNTGLVINQGTTTTYPTITIKGPATNPTVGSFTSGQFIQLNYSLVATDTVVIDLLNRTITLNGNPARNLITGTSQWFAAPPGTSKYYFTATGTTAGAGATITYYNAYI